MQNGRWHGKIERHASALGLQISGRGKFRSSELFACGRDTVSDFDEISGHK